MARQTLLIIISFLVTCSFSYGEKPRSGTYENITTKDFSKQYYGHRYGQRAASTLDRIFIGLTTGHFAPRMGHRGTVFQVLGGKRLLLIGNYYLPQRGSTVVIHGPWSFDSKFREGIVWGGMWQYFQWPKEKDMAVFLDSQTKEYDEELLEEGNAFRRKLLSGRDFLLARRSSLAGFTPPALPLDVTIEIYNYKRLASKAQVAAARIHLERFYRRERLRRRSRAMGRGPISNMGVRDFSSWSGLVKVDMLTTDVPKAQSTAWYVEKEKVLLFIGSSAPLVHDVAVGFLNDYISHKY